MVRFSDIIKLRDKKERRDESGRKKVGEDKFKLSDSQAFNRGKEKIETKEKIDLQPSTSLKDNASLEVVTCYEKFIERAIDIRDRVKSNQGISPSPVLSDLHNVINKGLQDDLYEYAMSAPDDYEEMLIHTIDVTFISLRVGMGMGYDIKMLLRLGLAAFFENVGMYKIPESILKRTGKLDKEEINIIKKHPEISSDILGLWLSRSMRDQTARVIRQD